MKRRKPDSPANSFFLYLFFIYVVETAAALQALCPGLWLSHFLWRKKKKRKRENDGAGVSLKKRYFSRFNFCYLVCRSLKCDFGKASLPKMIYQDFAAGRVLVLLRAVLSTAAAKSAYTRQTPRRRQLKSVYTRRTLTPEPLQQIFLQREQLFKRYSSSAEYVFRFCV